MINATSTLNVGSIVDWPIIATDNLNRTKERLNEHYQMIIIIT